MCNNSMPTRYRRNTCAIPKMGASTRVGDPQPQQSKHPGLILLLIGGEHGQLESLLREQGYRLVVPATADHAVAICLNNRIQAVLIDSQSLHENEDWSLAQSVRAVSPDTPVLLLVHSSAEQANVPEAVDCVVRETDPQQILIELRKCVLQSAQSDQRDGRLSSRSNQPNCSRASRD